MSRVTLGRVRQALHVSVQQREHDDTGGWSGSVWKLRIR